MRPTRFALIAGLALTALAGISARTQQFVDAQRANQAALHQYSWKSRTDVLVDGTSRQVRLEQVRYDFDGRLQKTTIGGGQTSPESSRPGPPGRPGEVRKRVIAKKKDGFRDLLANLAELADAYAHLPPDRVQAFAAGATTTQGQGIETGSVRIQASGVLSRGDRLTIWVDPAGFAMRRVEIATSYDDHPVTIGVDYRTLDAGPAYPARSVLRYPKKQVEIVVETFDYVRSSTR